MSSLAQATPLRLAILVADEPLPSVAARLGGFADIFTTLLRAATEGLSPPQPLESHLALTAHDVVVAGDAAATTAYPDPETIDAVLITGSRHAAHADDAWVLSLVAYTRRLLDGGRVRVLGVCFGHQIAARALGAPVGRSPHGWELSVTRVELTAEGKRVFGAEFLVSPPPSLEGKERKEKEKGREPHNARVGISPPSSECYKGHLLN